MTTFDRTGRHRLRRASDACRTSRRCCRIWRVLAGLRRRSRGSIRSTPTQLSAEIAAHLAAGMARQERLCRRPTPRSSPIRCSTAGRPAPRSSIASTACSFCSARTWRRRSAARSTTTSPRNGSTAIRACAPRSSSRCRTSNTRSTRSSAAPRTSASCRCWCWRCRRCRSAGGISGRSMRPASATACRSASTPARPIAIR